MRLGEVVYNEFKIVFFLKDVIRFWMFLCFYVFFEVNKYKYFFWFYKIKVLFWFFINEIDKVVNYKIKFNRVN